MKLIDKDALVAEIERRIKEHKRYANSNRNNMIEEDVAILSFINTLEVKEVDEEPYVMSDKGKFTTTTK